MTIRSFTYEVKVNLNSEVGYGAEQWQRYRDLLQLAIDTGLEELVEVSSHVSSIQVQEE